MMKKIPKFLTTLRKLKLKRQLRRLELSYREAKLLSTLSKIGSSEEKEYSQIRDALFKRIQIHKELLK